jgi:hypothetical protein
MPEKQKQLLKKKYWLGLMQRLIKMGSLHYTLLHSRISIKVSECLLRMELIYMLRIVIK